MAGIETGLMAELVSGEVVRIVAITEFGIAVECEDGVKHISPRRISRTYSPVEGIGRGYEPYSFNDFGIELPGGPDE